MIITSHIEFEIGKIYTYDDLKVPFEYCGKQMRKYRFIVLSSASEKEFYEYVKMEFPDLDIIGFEYFYRISMD